MKIIFFTLLILVLLAFLIYKIRQNFSKKELFLFFGVIFAIILTSVYYNGQRKNAMPNAFKAYYLNHQNNKILKLSYSQINMEVLNSNKNIYNFNYIVDKNTQQYFCEAKNIEIIQIEDEFIFKNFKEECKSQ